MLNQNYLRALFALILIAATVGCGSSKNKNGSGAGGSQVYGKPGPGVGESCYVGKANGPHSCMQVAPNDPDALAIMLNSCSQNEGTRAHGTCKTDNFVANCNNIPGGAVVKVRYYQMPLDRAKSLCDAEGGTLSRYYGN